MDTMITCPACGAMLPQGTKHCTECGAKLTSPQSEFDAPAAAAFEAASDTAARAEEAVSEAEAVFGAPFAQQPPSAFLGDIPAAAEVSQEKPEPAYPSPAAPAVPAAAPAASAAPAPSPYAAPAAPAAPYAAPAAAPAAAHPAPAAYPPPAAQVREDPDKPGKKSKYAPMSSVGMALEIFLMSIPVVGFILMILWSCGVCRKIARRNLARAYLILLIVALVLAVAGALLARFVFKDQITQLVEQAMPGYTIQWN